MLGNMLRDREAQYVASKDEATQTWRILDTWHDVLRRMGPEDEIEDDSEAITLLTEGAFIALVKEAARLGVLQNATGGNTDMFESLKSGYIKELEEKDQEIAEIKKKVVKYEEGRRTGRLERTVGKYKRVVEGPMDDHIFSSSNAKLLKGSTAKIYGPDGLLTTQDISGSSYYKKGESTIIDLKTKGESVDIGNGMSISNKGTARLISGPKGIELFDLSGQRLELKEGEKVKGFGYTPIQMKSELGILKVDGSISAIGKGDIDGKPIKLGPTRVAVRDLTLGAVQTSEGFDSQLRIPGLSVKSEGDLPFPGVGSLSEVEADGSLTITGVSNKHHSYPYQGGVQAPNMEGYTDDITRLDAK